MAEAKRFSDGLSTAPDWRKAVAEAAGNARAKLGPSPCDLALVFVSQAWDDFDARELSPLLAKHLAPLHTLGCNAGGVVAGRREVEAKPGVAVLAMRLPDVRVSGFTLSPRELERMEDGRSLVAALDIYPTDRPKFLAFSDPKTCDSQRLTEIFNQAYPGAPLVGGLSSGHLLRRAPWMLLGSELVEDGTAFVAMTGEIEFETMVAQGCRPIGEPLVVTRAEGNLLQELGGRPPLEVLREMLARCTPEDQLLARESLFAGLARDERLSGFQRGDFVVRSLLGFDSDSGALKVGASLRRGQTLQFQLRDARTSDLDLQSMLGALPDAGSAPRGALLVNCCGRGVGLYGDADHDSALVQSMRGPMPMAGFFASGEYGPVDSRNFIHGASSSLVVFR
ncbi:MAG: hypothetical protein A2506_07900 [Elusimicrobia bacterium RIFOXYD12_FULL_66_9]|nr:MAG: hypothetical protein A2506_07900 [Elusimicrobia bacterium RIFOXYD12_FULL_66_9]